MQSLIGILDDTFRPLFERQDERYEALFGLQELTRVTLAAYLYNKVVASPAADNQDEEDRPGYLAEWIMQRILKILSEYDQFETNVSCPSTKWEYLIAFLNRGPPSFDKYFYLYGLLDCATQLGRVVDHDRTPQPLRERMERIVRDSKDDSFRWKAVSISAIPYLQLPTAPSNA